MEPTKQTAFLFLCFHNWAQGTDSLDLWLVYSFAASQQLLCKINHHPKQNKTKESLSQEHSAWEEKVQALTNETNHW